MIFHDGKGGHRHGTQTRLQANKQTTNSMSTLMEPPPLKEKTSKSNQIKTVPARQLGYAKVFHVDTVVRAGCSKSTTSDCGINYRGS